jgi:hypothetical protein
MTPLEQEIDNNHQSFLADWIAQSQENLEKLRNKDKLVQSYRRLSALNAIQHILIAPTYSRGSAAFFLEAQNDALVSHVNAHVGSWRTALKSLRSCIENALNSIYFSEHPVELELWSRGELRTWFQELHKYFLKHPRISAISPEISGLNDLKAEYELLSKAVHASAASFRMTDGAAKVLLWSTEDAKLGAWSTREKKVIDGVCALIICMFSAELQGAKNGQLREMLSFVTRSGRRTAFKKNLGINLVAP